MFQSGKEYWIVCKQNEEGVNKVAQCKSNVEFSLSDECTGANWIDLEGVMGQMQISSKPTGGDTDGNRRSSGYTRAFIKDALNFEKREGFYYDNNRRVNTVMICGTVTGITNEKPDKFSFRVDDSTSSIICVVKRSLFELEGMEEFDEELEEDGPNSKLMAATAIIQESITAPLKLLKNSFEDCSVVGQFVLMFGKLNEYKDDMYFFVDQMEICEHATARFMEFVRFTLNEFKTRRLYGI